MERFTVTMMNQSPNNIGETEKDDDDHSHILLSLKNTEQSQKNYTHGKQPQVLTRIRFNLLFN